MPMGFADSMGEFMGEVLLTADYFAPQRRQRQTVLHLH